MANSSRKLLLLQNHEDWHDIKKTNAKSEKWKCFCMHFFTMPDIGFKILYPVLYSTPIHFLLKTQLSLSVHFYRGSGQNIRMSISSRFLQRIKSSKFITNCCFLFFQVNNGMNFWKSNHGLEKIPTTLFIRCCFVCCVACSLHPQVKISPRVLFSHFWNKIL